MPTPIHLSPDLEQLLTQRARDSNRTLEQYVEHILRWATGFNPVLSEREAAILSSAGFPLARSALVETAERRSHIIATSLRLDDAAAMLGVPPSQLLEGLTYPNSPVYAIQHENEWRFPDFQFDGGRPVPMIGEVIKMMPRDLDLVAVDNWFRLPNVDLVPLGREPLSPIAWLKQHRNYRLVLALLEDL